MTHLMILLGTIQKGHRQTHKYGEKKKKNNDMKEGVFKIQWNTYNGAFLQK